MAGEDERLDAVPIKAAEAAAALESLKAPAQEAATAIEDAFGRAGDSLTRSLTRAAADGEVTLAELARAVLNAVNAAAGSRGKGGLSDAISAVMSSFGGARADWLDLSTGINPDPYPLPPLSPRGWADLAPRRSPS